MSSWLSDCHIQSYTNPTSRPARTTVVSALHCTAVHHYTRNCGLLPTLLHCVLGVNRTVICMCNWLLRSFLIIYCARSSMSHGELRYLVFELRDIFSSHIRCNCTPSLSLFPRKVFFLLSNFNFIFTKSKFCEKWEFRCFAHNIYVFFLRATSVSKSPTVFLACWISRDVETLPTTSFCTCEVPKYFLLSADMCQLVFRSWKYSFQRNYEIFVSFLIADLKLL
jgi:hypothetical protein